jgi:molecular chaperone DnaJ
LSTRDYLEKDFYKALGVPKDAATADIKKAYRKLARKYHPDANKGDAKSEERFKEISEAYAVLSDDTKRKEYDEARTLFGTGATRTAGGGFNFDLGDLFGGHAGGQAGGGLGDLLGGLFGGRRTTPAQPRRGQDLEAEVRIAFPDAVHGVTVPLRLSTPHTCPTCRGTGAKPGSTPRVCPRCEGVGTVSRNAGGFGFAEPCRECRGRGLLIDDPCATCNGTGTAMSERTMRVRIPAGVADGQRIRLKGKGQPGLRGAPAGDLNVLVHVTADPIFGRKADNLTITVPVTFAEAALGATVKVPTLGGMPVTVKIPAGTSSGRVLRVRGRGVPRRDGTRGDLLVTVEVAVPKDLSPEAREALQSFAQSQPEDPRAHLNAMVSHD